MQAQVMVKAEAVTLGEARGRKANKKRHGAFLAATEAADFIACLRESSSALRTLPPEFLLLAVYYAYLLVRKCSRQLGKVEVGSATFTFRGEFSLAWAVMAVLRYRNWVLDYEHMRREGGDLPNDTIMKDGSSMFQVALLLLA